MQNFFQTLLVGGSVIVSFLGGLFSPVTQNSPSPTPEPIPESSPLVVGAAIPVPVASFSTSLASKIASTDTSMTLVSVTTDDGTTLTNGSFYGFVLDVGTADEEYVVGTASSTSIVNMTRGISAITGNTSISALKKEHRRGASVKISDAPVLLVMARILNGDETIPNVLKYNFSTSTGITLDSQLVNKKYVDTLAYGTSTFWITSGSDLYNGNSGAVMVGTSTLQNSVRLQVADDNSMGALFGGLTYNLNPTDYSDLLWSQDFTSFNEFRIRENNIATTTNPNIQFISTDGSNEIPIGFVDRNNNPKLWIASSSKIGIGTSTPSSTISVIGTAYISSSTTFGGSIVGKNIPFFYASTSVASTTINSATYLSLSTTTFSMTYPQRVLVTVAGTAFNFVAGNQCMETIAIDNVTVDGGNDLAGAVSPTINAMENMSLSWISDPLTVGSHTFNIRGRANAGGVLCIFNLYRITYLGI